MMEKVDYLKLAELYASFLVAVGGVSITALTLVLSLGWETKGKPRLAIGWKLKDKSGLAIGRKSKGKPRLAKGDSHAFLVAALVVATVCCFVGAHMMAETAAFIEHVKEQAKKPAEEQAKEPAEEPANNKNPRPLGERPFLLASTNIFMAAVLVLFALMLLPMAARDKQAARVAPISALVFAFIVIATILWMFRAAIHRMPSPNSYCAVARGIIISVVWGIFISCFLVCEKCMGWRAFNLIPRKLRPKDEKARSGCLLWATYIPIISFTAVSLVYFTLIFGDAGEAHDKDIFFFSLAVSFSYASLIVAGIKTMCGDFAVILSYVSRFFARIKTMCYNLVGGKQSRKQ